MPVLFDRGPCKIVGFKGEPMQKHLQCNEGGGGGVIPRLYIPNSNKVNLMNFL